MLVDKQSELMSDLLFTVHQHGGDDAAWKPPIPGETAVILGDSIIQNLQGYKLGKEVHHRVGVKSFRGSTANGMRSYIQPTLENSPERICLHIGTNDLKNKEPRDVADAIVDLARTLESSGEFKILYLWKTFKQGRTSSY